MKDKVPSHNARPFFDTIRDLRRGSFIDECADELQRVVAAVEETGKAGKLVIEIAVSPASKGQGAVKVADKIVAKLPALPAGETIMFVTTDNNLVANMPGQGELLLRSVEDAPTALREVSA
ncbi:hypothetical protein ED236_00285 [Pseudomethylobacillus aquaticus]|uniref:Uncharacterized protein n=1 Tax=Pseudomethylobacillus aquaticus TaxID=2676064 RepID=A0A3N0V599_9PROT|nr:hypothetical protein [Pseudomethylobacillus aquaticus]ROH87966.1 hypothetical protein ED236_00285 [Pseudomethylobacillus aquaticus]